MTDKRFIRQINIAIEEIAKGRSRALEDLFMLTKKHLLIVAKSYLYDRSKAEDVLSESYYKAVKNADKFDRRQNGYNWLYEIVKNTALNQNKKDKLREYLPAEEAPSYDIIDEILNGLMVEQAETTLSEEEKRVIYEYFFEKRTLREIAENISKSGTTVYDMIQKIIKKMRKNLGLTEQQPTKNVYKSEDGNEEKRD